MCLVKLPSYDFCHNNPGPRIRDFWYNKDIELNWIETDACSIPLYFIELFKFACYFCCIIQAKFKLVGYKTCKTSVPQSECDFPNSYIYIYIYIYICLGQCHNQHWQYIMVSKSRSKWFHRCNTRSVTNTTRCRRSFKCHHETCIHNMP